MTDIAIVILNWNTRQQLEQFLPNVLAHSKEKGVEVVVADNGSTDDSVAYMRENHPGVRLIEFDTNHGFTGGYNRALAQIEARYYLLLNSDVEVTSGWLQPLKACMEENSSVAACMPKMKSWHQPKYFEYAGAAGGFIDKYGYPFCRGRILEAIEQDQGQYDKDSEIFWATGACMLVRSDLFHQEGGFDEAFFAHMEEIDLCWRLKNKGHSIRYVHESTVYHVGGGTLPNNSPFKLFLNYRNNLFLLYKNLPAKRLNQHIQIRKSLDILSSLVFLTKANLQGFRAVLKAHRHFRKALPELKKKRQKNAPTSGNFPSGIYPKSILWDYFIRRRRSFALLNFTTKPQSNEQ